MYATVKSFAYHAPSTLSEACGLLADLGPDAAILAGGCDLLPALRRRQRTPSAVVSLVRIPALGHVAFDGSTLRVGALASLWAVERFEPVQRWFPSLHEGIGGIASVQVRTTGTLVGNLCVATPASDIAVPLITLEARVRIVGRHGERVIPVAQLGIGAKRSCLAADEIVVEMMVDRPPEPSGGAFGKLTRTAADCAKLNAAVHVELIQGVCRTARIALGSVAPTPVRAPQAEAVLEGRALDDSMIVRAGRAAAEHIDPIDDIRSTAAYRKQATETLVARLLSRAWQRATGGAS